MTEQMLRKETYSRNSEICKPFTGDKNYTLRKTDRLNESERKEPLQISLTLLPGGVTQPVSDVPSVPSDRVLKFLIINMYTM